MLPIYFPDRQADRYLADHIIYRLKADLRRIGHTAARLGQVSLSPSERVRTSRSSSTAASGGPPLDQPDGHGGEQR
jgi:hypothetical protein